jgi:TM2 domain-containing membrane protein YozV
MEFCPNCGRMVDPNVAYCQYCGAPLRMHSSFSSRQPYDPFTDTAPSYHDGKRPWVAAALALVLGLFGIWGVGHIYAGRFARGMGFLFAGLIIGGLFWLSVVLTVILIGYVGMVLVGLVFVGGYLWQAFDAYVVAQEYNELHVPPQRTSW